MYCPKCNQAQASEEMRYCSRCGFPLTTVALLLQNDGKLPPQPAARAESRRGRMATESVALTVLSWAVALTATWWFDVGGPFEFIAKVGAGLFGLIGLIGLFRFLYAFLFVRQGEGLRAENTQREIPEYRERALSPQQSSFVDVPTKTTTKEIVQPISVTESTTRLLDEPDQH
jgi:hypothetical protein